MRLSRTAIFSYLLALFLVYSSIANFSIYFIGLIPISGIFVILCLYGLQIRPSIISKGKTNDTLSYIFVWSIIFSISLFVNGAFPRFLMIYNSLVCLFILTLRDDIQIDVYKKFVWLLTFLLILSTVEYIIIILTGKGLIIAHVTRVTQAAQRDFNHYLFNIITPYNILYRFKGLFAEPGNLGTLCAFLLFTTWRNKSMRFPFYVCLACGLMSLSLGFYIFLLIFLITHVNLNIKAIGAGVVLVAAFLYLFGDNFQDRLVDRVTDVDDVEELDNRTTEIFNRYFERAYYQDDLWLGVGSDNMPSEVYSEGGNAGAKKWIFQYGIFGAILVFIVYNVIFYRRCKKRLGYHDLVFLFVYWICFYKTVSFLNPTLFLVFILTPIINRQTNEL